MNEKVITTEEHQGLLIGVSAFKNEIDNNYVISALFELDTIHPNEGWNFVVSGNNRYVNEDELVKELVLAFKNIGRMLLINCRWNEDQPSLCSHKFLSKKHNSMRFNPINCWPKNRREHDIQIYAMQYFPSYTESLNPIVIMGTSKLGQDLINNKVIPKLKSN